MTAIAFSKVIGPVPVDVVISHQDNSDLAITKVPIETGAEATDHAFRLPALVTMEIAAQNASATWKALKAFQESRAPFTLVTGLDIYPNMLIQHMDAKLDKDNANVLIAKVDTREIIIVSSAVSNSGQPGGAKSTRSATPQKGSTKGTKVKQRSTQKVVTGDNSTSIASTSTTTSPASTSVGTPTANRSILSRVVN